ncbi:MAG: hypothetical protein ACK50I_02515 [Burkholderiales bacterium]|jgi:hypothetical protein|nr:hypothetical protein [Novosphingobium sp.]
MSRDRIRLAVLVALLAATAIVVLSADPPGASTPSVVQPVARTLASTTPAGTRNDAVLDTAQPAGAASRSPWSESAIDIFADPPPPKPVAPPAVRVKAEAAPPPPPPPAPVVQEPPPPPRFPLQPLGQMQQDAERVAFLLGPQGPLLARVGTTVAGEWLVETVTESNLQVMHVGTSHRIAVPLPPTR